MSAVMHSKEMWVYYQRNGSGNFEKLLKYFKLLFYFLLYFFPLATKKEQNPK